MFRMNTEFYLGPHPLGLPEMMTVALNDCISGVAMASLMAWASNTPARHQEIVDISPQYMTSDEGEGMVWLSSPTHV